MKRKINEVLSVSLVGSAAEMSHALTELGGDMGAGIRILWELGKKTGLIIGGLVSGATVLAGTSFAGWKVFKVQEQRHIQNMSVIYEAGKAAAIREIQEQESNVEEKSENVPETTTEA